MALPEHTPITIEALQAIALRHGIARGNAARRLVALPQTGIINANYALGRRHVLRVPRNHPAHIEQLRREVLAAPAARAAGVHTPALVAFDDRLDLLPAPYAVYARVRGRALGSLAIEPAAAADVWRAFGRDLARLHAGVPANGPAGPATPLGQSREPVDPRALVERRASAGWFGAPEVRWLTRWLNRLAPEALTLMPRRLVHADTQDSNVLVRPSRTAGGGGGGHVYGAVLDWGCAHWDDAALDLACGLLRAAPFLLAGHREVAPLDADETAEARVLWHSLRMTLEMLPRGSAPGWAWAERPLARLLDALRYFFDSPPAPWAALAPPGGDAQEPAGADGGRRRLVGLAGGQKQLATQEDGALKRYPPHEWIAPQLELRASPIAGRGMFARTAIRAGEPVIVWGGWVCTSADVAAGRVAPRSTVYIGEDTFLGARVGEYDRERDDRGDFINHACDANVWLADENTLVARRDIAAGEELTIDYALFEGDEDDVKPWDCRCGSPLCRHRIAGRDWRLPELQEWYRGHFSPFINRRIERLRSVSHRPPAQQAGSGATSARRR